MTRRPFDCYDMYSVYGQERSRKYTVYLGREEYPLHVYCDMSNGNGWLVIYLLTYLLTYLLIFLFVRLFACLFI